MLNNLERHFAQETKSVKAEILPDTLWNELAEYYIEDALAIIDILEEGNGVIVHAPHGAGKTRLLTPSVKRLAEAQGWALGKDKDNPDSHSSVFVGEYEYIKSFEKDLTDIYGGVKPGHKKLFILDEAYQMGLAPLNRTEPAFTYFKNNNILPVLLNAARNERKRIKSGQNMITVAKKFGLTLEIYQQKQRGFFPIEMVKKYLGGGNIEPALFEFLTHPQNEAFRSLRLFDSVLKEIIISEGMFYSQPMRTLEELQKYALENWRDWLEFGLWGGSKETLVRALTNLGVINSNDQFFIDSLLDYD